MSEAEKETEDKKKAGINDFLYAQNLPWFAELIELELPSHVLVQP